MGKKTRTHPKPLLASWKLLSVTTLTLAIVGIILVYTQKPEHAVQGASTQAISGVPTIAIHISPLPTSTQIFYLPRRR